MGPAQQYGFNHLVKQQHGDGVAYEFIVNNESLIFKGLASKASLLVMTSEDVIEV